MLQTFCTKLFYLSPDVSFREIPTFSFLWREHHLFLSTFSFSKVCTASFQETGFIEPVAVVAAVAAVAVAIAVAKQ